MEAGEITTEQLQKPWNFRENGGLRAKSVGLSLYRTMIQKAPERPVEVQERSRFRLPTPEYPITLH